jgi:hypothetical protein
MRLDCHLVPIRTLVSARTVAMLIPGIPAVPDLELYIEPKATRTVVLVYGSGTTMAGLVSSLDEDRPLNLLALVFQCPFGIPDNET